MRKLLIALAVGTLAAGCGGGDDGKPQLPPGTPDPEAKAAAQRYLDAYAARDPKAICASLTHRVQRELASNKGTCLKTMRFSLNGSSDKFPKLVVKEAYADGPKAVAVLEGSPRQITLARDEAVWKVANGGQ